MQDLPLAVLSKRLAASYGAYVAYGGVNAAFELKVQVERNELDPPSVLPRGQFSARPFRPGSGSVRYIQLRAGFLMVLK